MEEHKDQIRTFIYWGTEETSSGYPSNFIPNRQITARTGCLPDIGLKASVDSFAGMLLHGILRFSDIPTTLEYSRECYMKTWVNLFLRGINTLPLQDVIGCANWLPTR